MIMRTLRQARARATEPADRTTSTQAEETDIHEGITESNNTIGVPGDEAESGSREDVTGGNKHEDGEDMAACEAGRTAEGRDTSGEDNTEEWQNAAT
jgi:hypothetical protein